MKFCTTYGTCAKSQQTIESMPITKANHWRTFITHSPKYLNTQAECIAAVRSGGQWKTVLPLLDPSWPAAAIEYTRLVPIQRCSHTIFKQVLSISLFNISLAIIDRVFG